MKFNRPGCFGYVATFNAKSKVCQACDHKAACETKAKSSIEELGKRLNVDAVKRLMFAEKQKAAAIAAQQKPTSMREKILSRMPAHVARTAGMILDVRVNHRMQLLQGVNSMRGRKPATISILFDLLIDGPVSRQRYIEALQGQLGYTSGTASSQASICMSAVVGIGIAKEAEEGRIVIRGDK